MIILSLKGTKVNWTFHFKNLNNPFPLNCIVLTHAFRVAWRSWLLKVPPSFCSVQSVGKYTELGPELDPSQEPYPIQFSIYLFLDIPTPGWKGVYYIFWRIICDGGGEVLLVNFRKLLISGHFSLHLILQRVFRWFFLFISFYVY